MKYISLIIQKKIYYPNLFLHFIFLNIPLNFLKFNNFQNQIFFYQYNNQLYPLLKNGMRQMKYKLT